MMSDDKPFHNPFGALSQLRDSLPPSPTPVTPPPVQKTAPSARAIPRAEEGISYSIPAFKLGQPSSAPISLEVLPATTQSGKGAELFLENTFSSEQVYVQQMLYYEVKIYFKGEQLALPVSK